MDKPTPPVREEIVAGVELVRHGMSVVAAATQVGCTEAALRTACRRAGVTTPKFNNNDTLRRARAAARDADIAHRWRERQPIEEICHALSVTPTLVKRVVKDLLGEEIALPTRTKRTRERALTLIQEKAAIAADDYIARRARGHFISLSGTARLHNVNRDAVRWAVMRRLQHDFVLDDSSSVSDTAATKETGR